MKARVQLDLGNLIIPIITGVAPDIMPTTLCIEVIGIPVVRHVPMDPKIQYIQVIQPHRLCMLWKVIARGNVMQDIIVMVIFVWVALKRIQILPPAVII